MFNEKMLRRHTESSLRVCYGHKSSTGTVQRLFHQTSYDSTAPVRRPAGGRNNRTSFGPFYKHRTMPGEVKVLHVLKNPRRPYGVL